MGLLTHVEDEIKAIVIKVLEELDLYHPTTVVPVVPPVPVTDPPAIPPAAVRETPKEKIEDAIAEVKAENDVGKGEEVK